MAHAVLRCGPTTMRNTLVASLAFAALSLSVGTGCHVRSRYGYYGGGGYYRAQPVYVQQQPAYVQQTYVQQQPTYVQPTYVQQQPAQVYVQQQQPYYDQQPVVLQQQPEVYYPAPTGVYQRPAVYNGVRVYIAQ